jgi:uncharacterized Zn finger protein
MPEKLKGGSTQCPGCGTLQPAERWIRIDKVFETVSCANCGNEWGRIIGTTFTGQWHILGATAEHGLLLSRRAHATEVKKM